MRTIAVACAVSAAVLAASSGAPAFAQPPGITMEMINTVLPLEGAPLAEPGPYEVTSGPAFGSPRHVVFRPAQLDAIPAENALPIVVWGNGGCAINSTRYGGFLTTIASHGFVVLATAAIEGEPRRQATAADLAAAIDWAEAENEREGSPLEGRVATDRVAVMGQSCGGFLSIELGADPRVDTIGVFNSGVEPPSADGESRFATTDALADLHGPVLLINGHERDFLMQASRANFDLIDHVPAFYGARHGAGHTATVDHPGGGEFANVASAWVRYQLKHDADASRMFVGRDCTLCTDPEWDTDSKGLAAVDPRTAETEQVVMRHLAASEAGDASVVPRDYAADAVVIFGDTATRGVEGVQKVFENLYARTRLELEYTRRVFDGEMGYVVWTMGELTGSDTFVVRDGKIVAQTGVVFAP